MLHASVAKYNALNYYLQTFPFFLRKTIVVIISFGEKHFFFFFLKTAQDRYPLKIKRNTKITHPRYTK